MPDFKTKEEYEEWKAKKIQEALNAKELHQSVAPDKESNFSDSNTDSSMQPSKKKLKKIIILVVVAFILVVGIILYSSYPALDKSKFEGVYHAAKTIEGATSIGVNYQKFIEVLQNLSTEISIVKDRVANEKEVELLIIYNIAQLRYQLSLALWKTKIQDSGSLYERLGYICIGKSEKHAIELNKEYNIPISQFEGSRETLDPRFDMYIPENSIQLIWTKAREDIEKAEAILKGNKK